MMRQWRNRVACGDDRTYHGGLEVVRQIHGKLDTQLVQPYSFRSLLHRYRLSCMELGSLRIWFWKVWNTELYRGKNRQGNRFFKEYEHEKSIQIKEEAGHNLADVCTQANSSNEWTIKIRNLALYYSMLLLCTAMQAYRSDIKTSYFK